MVLDWGLCEGWISLSHWGLRKPHWLMSQEQEQESGRSNPNPYFPGGWESRVRHRPPGQTLLSQLPRGGRRVWCRMQVGWWLRRRGRGGAGGVCL